MDRLKRVNTRLIAVDLDGTLLDEQANVSARNRAALDAARDAGIGVVPVTGRQRAGIATISEQAAFTDWAICSNGADGSHLRTGERLFEHNLSAQVQREFGAVLTAELPEAKFVAVRNGNDEYVAQDGFNDMARRDGRHGQATLAEAPLDEVLGTTNLKLIVAHPQLRNDALLAAIDSLGIAGIEATHSGTANVEIATSGVTKATGLAALCEYLGIAAEQVLAFGNAPNDVHMLTWAGRGVAVGNAEAAALAVADEVTDANTDDGVAQYLERHVLAVA